MKQVWLAAALVVGAASTAFADSGGVEPVTSAAPRTAGNQSWAETKLAGSYGELSTFVGTGTFYSSGYHNPYVSNALYLRPTYVFGGKHDIVANARIYVEEEYTQPDNAAARRFYPLDTWLNLIARNLYTGPRSQVQFQGLLRVVVPTSYESLYAHMLGGLGVGGGAKRVFQFGQPDARGKRWELTAAATLVFTKYLHTSALRGSGPGDTTGCLAPASLPTGTAGSDGSSPSAAGSDHCGGPLNTSFSFMPAGGLALARGHFTFSLTLIVINNFRYAAPVDAFSPTDVPRGREDFTWGITTLNYAFNDHLGVALGISSYQPAMDAAYRNLRFPFFDFSGTNANNYTQLFVNLNGTI